MLNEKWLVYFKLFDYLIIKYITYRENNFQPDLKLTPCTICYRYKRNLA